MKLDEPAPPYFPVNVVHALQPPPYYDRGRTESGIALGWTIVAVRNDG